MLTTNLCAVKGDDGVQPSMNQENGDVCREQPCLQERGKIEFLKLESQKVNTVQ